jgi:two-component system, OmpR family, response regulator
MSGRIIRRDEDAVVDALSSTDQLDWRAKSIFTTGEVADICRISQQTVIRCFDSGKLNGFRVPGSKFRRIPREALLAFMREHSIPVENINAGKRKVLVVDDDKDIVDMLVDILTRDGRFDVKSASNGFDAGALTKEFQPDIMLLDYMLPDINGNIVCSRVRSDPQLTETRIIIVSGAVDPAEIESLKAAGADDFIKKPFDIDHLIARMVELLTV